jgi:hypothetical protein
VSGAIGSSSSIATAAGTTIGVTLIGIATAQWAVIAVGLSIGITARWAYLMSLKKALGWREMRIDLMMFPMNGVLTAQLVDELGIHDGRLLLTASMFGAASTMAFAEVHRRWLNKSFTPTPKIFSAPGSITHIPADTSEVDVVAVGSATPLSVSSMVIKIIKDSPAPAGTDDFDRLLKEIDDEPS